MADMVTVWPEFSKRDLDRIKTELRAEWLPLREKLSQNIERVGVLAKNERLLSLERNARELEDRMWQERNEKSGQLYLISEWRQVMRAIAEEKGELGEGAGSQDNTLLGLAQTLADIIRVQGTGIQGRNVVEGEFVYYPDEEKNAENALPGQSGGVSEDEVPPEPGADQVSPV